MKKRTSPTASEPSRILESRIEPRDPQPSARRPQRPSLIEALEPRIALSGTWHAVAASGSAPSGTEALMLLSDGTVMAQVGTNSGGGESNTWYALKPDAFGSYVNGAWSVLDAMAEKRLFFSTATMTNGKVFAVGGEYSSSSYDFTNTAEIYDPVTDNWTNAASVPTPLTQFKTSNNNPPANPSSQYGDDPIVVLPDGKILAGYFNGPQTFIYDPVANTWSAGGNKLRGDASDEETWVKLKDGSILSYDVFSSDSNNTGVFHAQRYIPATDKWVDASNLNNANPPSVLSQPTQGSELGPAFLQPDGKVIFFGANGKTAIYDPVANQWSAGPNEPIKGGKQQAAYDNPGAMMPNGHILIAMSELVSPFKFPGGALLYEYDPTAQTFTEVPPVNAIGSNAFGTNMVLLPSGEVLLGDEGGKLQIFTPNGAPPDSARPTISSITNNGGGLFTLHGTQLNGLSEGSTYGDDNESVTNYPLIQFKDVIGRVFYGRTSNWSSTGVDTGTADVSTQFTLPAGKALSDFTSYTVIANGIPSLPANAAQFDAGHTTLTLRVNPGDDTKLQLLDGGNNVLGTYPNHTPGHFSIIGDAGNNTLTLDESFGVIDRPVDFTGGGTAGAPGDSVIVVGSASSDVFAVAGTGTDSEKMKFANSPDYAFTGLQGMALLGAAGNDTLTVDSTTSLVELVSGIRFDGGSGHDSLQLLQTGGTPQTSDVYSIGPDNGQGSSVISGGGATQTVQFQNIEPVLDLVPAASLFVNATSANNALNYGPGSVAANALVTIDNFESIEFTAKTALTLNGLEGSDQISLHNDVAPTGLTDITVNGGDPTGGDQLIITGTAASDAFTFAGLSPSAGNVTGLAVPVHFTTTEHVTLDGLSGDDTFNLKGNAGSISLRGGAGVDGVNFSTAGESVVFDLDAVGVAQRVTTTDAEVTLLDRVENFTGSGFNDILSLDAAPFARSIDGFAEPGDLLHFDGQGAVVTVMKTDFNTGTIKTKGYADVTFDKFQIIDLQNTPSGPGGFGPPGSNSDAFATAHIYDDTLFKSGGKPVPGRGPTAVATGDLNGDGFADMVVVNSKTKNLSILLNQGDGTFLDPVNIGSGGSAPQDLVIGDFDNDTKLDLVVANPGSGNIAFFHGNNDGTFAAPTLTLTPKFKPFALATADLNNDAKPDLVAVSRSTSTVEVLLGNNAGGFALSTPVKTVGMQPVDVVIADFNADGKLDVATANNASGNVSFLAGNNTGALAAAALFRVGPRPTGLAVGDLDGDGKLDLAVSNQLSRFVSVLLGVGNGAGAQFTPQLRVAVPGAHLSSAIVVGDFNGDGIADLGLGNTVGSNFTILLGAGLATYSQPYEFDLGKSANRAVTGGIAIADLNNDGQLDILATSYNTDDVRVLLRKV